jgi:hypothetical protein
MTDSRPTRIKLKLERDGGPGTRVSTVSADQRDWAAMEGADISYDATPVTGTRYMGFNAAVRAKLYAGTWEEFNARDCVSADFIAGKVVAVQLGSAEGEQGLDPGQKDQNDDA